MIATRSAQTSWRPGASCGSTGRARKGIDRHRLLKLLILLPQYGDRLIALRIIVDPGHLRDGGAARRGAARQYQRCRNDGRPCLCDFHILPSARLCKVAANSPTEGFDTEDISHPLVFQLRHCRHSNHGAGAAYFDVLTKTPSQTGGGVTFNSAHRLAMTTRGELAAGPASESLARHRQMISAAAKSPAR